MCNPAPLPGGITAVARDLGVSDQTVCDWRRQDRADRRIEPDCKAVVNGTAVNGSRVSTISTRCQASGVLRGAPDAWYREAPRSLPPARSARFVR